MITSAAGPPNSPDEQAAPIEERIDAALDVCEDLVAVLPVLMDRLDKLEAAAPATPEERRSDYRFETYPTPQSADDQAAQVERATQAWERLIDWVDWLVATYRLTTVIPACWPEHPAVVEELVALRVAWVGAWNDAANTDAPTGWQRRLHEAKGRLVDGNWGVSRCDGRHDGTGLDLAESFHTWQDKPERAKAITAARDRALGSLPALVMAPPGNATSPDGGQ